MAAGPQRRATPAPHLLAHVRGVELALQERAKALTDEVLATPESDDTDMIVSVTSAIKAQIAQEFLALAAELHFW